MSNVALALGISLLLATSVLVAQAMAATVMALRAGGRREDTISSDDARAESRFTIPVSLIVAAPRIDAALTQTIEALLALNYPEIEVLVVVDAAGNDGLGALLASWRLQAHEFFFRRSLESTAARRIYHSDRDERLTVIDQPSKSRADVLNCAISMARYRYVATVPSGITFDADALLRLMAAPLRDPSTVLGASAHIESMRHAARLRSIRALAASLLYWRHQRGGLPPSDAVIVWRRDALLEAGGFSTAAADIELDLTRRLLTARVSSGRFYRSGELFGRWASDRRRASEGRRRLGVLQFMRALTPTGVKAFGAKPLATFFAAELLTPAAEAWLMLGTALGAIAGLWTWWAVVTALGVAAFSRAVTSVAALHARGAVSGAPDSGELRGLVAGAPMEFLKIAR